MTGNDKIYPIDIDGALYLGVDRWRAEFRSPLPGAEYVRLFRWLLGVWIANAGKDPQSPAYQMAAIHYKMVPTLAQAYFDWLTLRKAREMGRDFVAGKTPEPIDKAMDRAKAVAVPLETFRLDAPRRAREWARIVRTNRGVGNGLLALVRQCFPRGDCAVGDPSKKEIAPYLSEDPAPRVWLRPELFLQGASAPPEISGPIERFADGVETALRAGNDAFFDDAVCRRLRELLLRTGAAWASARRALRGRPLGELLLTHMGNLRHRVLSSAWKASGGKTIGVVHGYPYPYSYSDGEPVIGARLVFSKYLVMSEGEKRLLESSRRDYPTGFESDDEIVVRGGDVYAELFARCQAAPPGPQTVRSVMLVGFPMDYLRANTLEMDTMTYLAFELDLLDALKTLGFEVVYKAHPDTLTHVDALFKGRVARVETRPFEQTLDAADCLLFSHPFSTTFGYALMSRRPIVLMSDAAPTGYRWHPEVAPLLRRRAALAEIALGPNGISFDRAALSDAIREAPKLMDDALVRRFAL